MLSVQSVSGRTWEGAVGSDVVDDEAGNEHKKNHEHFGPGEATAAHLYLQILEQEREEKLKLKKT